MQVGYCTNIHAGNDLPRVLANLELYALEVKRQVCPDRELGIGIWLSDRSVDQVLAGDNLENLKNWLGQNGLVPFTVNAFPQSDFHQDIVKHDVYRPNWASSRRLTYTLKVIDVLHHILPKGTTGSISTLPLGWQSDAGAPEFYHQCAAHLSTCAESLERIEEKSGRRIRLCLEPEPGCCLQLSADVSRFFEKFLFSRSDAARLQRYIAVCHDICHAAVMFEDQSAALQHYQDFGIDIGKTQVSSAIEADFRGKTAVQRAELIDDLSEFREPRYLHQTVTRGNGDSQFYEDLPLVLPSLGSETNLVARTHFHVPIYLSTCGALGTTRDQINRCVQWLAENQCLDHLEVETYAWNVSPRVVQSTSLANSLARELSWFLDLLKSLPRRD